MTYPWWNQTETNQTEARSDKRQFIVWDGEGVNHGRPEQGMSYVLFGHSAGGYISAYQLTSRQCLLFILQEANMFPGIHVSFGFSFDVDQILRDLPAELLTELKNNGVDGILWEGFGIKYLKGKYFEVTGRVARKKVTCKIYDTVSFFATSMINACRQYLPDDPRIDQVTAGKDGRSSFRFDELQSVILPYWKLEGELMVSLMVALRASLSGAGIKLNAWHGPGAIAQALLKREKLEKHIMDSRVLMPTQVTEATSYAYFGGRFENFIIGRIPGPIYSYDLRSAYPAALSQVPGLEKGQWVHNVLPVDIDQWGLYRVEYRQDPSHSVLYGKGALPFRGKAGTVSFGVSGNGWYYGHEVIAAQLIAPSSILVLEGWRYESNTQPFLFLKELYYQRRDWKREGNPAQLAAKLGLNSLYGKLAQLTGWDEDTNEPPKFHQQWYAGQITSWCRARIYLAMMQNPDAIIACETDGIYSTVPLDLDLGEHLGQWEKETYDEMVYVQSGVYFARVGGEWKKARVRGMSNVSVGIDTVLAHLDGFRSITGTVHRYGAMSGYIGKPRAHTWFDEQRTLKWGGGGKRYHNPAICPGCLGSGHSPAKIPGELDQQPGRPLPEHRTSLSRPDCGDSLPRLLPWEMAEDWSEDAPDDTIVETETHQPTEDQQ